MGTVDRRIAIRDARAARDRKDRAGIRVVRLRLDAGQYRRLRRFIDEYVDDTGQPVTQQAVLQAALTEYLAENEPPRG